MSLSPSVGQLRRLAGLYGVQTAYYDMFRHRRLASAEVLLAVLRTLGAPVSGLSDVPAAWREKNQARWRRLLEPVTVAWDGVARVEVRLPGAMSEAVLSGHLMLETGEGREYTWKGADLPVAQSAEVEGTSYVARQFTFPENLLLGYHHFTLEVAGRAAETLVISAPVKAYLPYGEKADRIWGAFIPLYALQTKRSWGMGDFGDLETLADWVAGRGGGMVATLPFLASFLDEPFAPSPYSPASRLFWNELYLDVSAIPELERCPRALAVISSPEFQNELSALRGSPLVDYRRQMTLKKRVLEELCRCLFSRPSARLQALEDFARSNPVVEDYARFRATVERRRETWRTWPQPLRGGTLKEGDYDEAGQRYHLYVQWLAHEQVRRLYDQARGKGVELYLDLPLGVHPDGYDVWREQANFVVNASVGAPPDVLFTSGQKWEFPPLHPERIRDNGYRYFIAYLRHHLQYAGMLRFDHVMGLHRLYWIPEGVDKSQGVYVRYNADELYAVLALESHRSRCIIVGEDLGTVPPEVRPAMRQHGLCRMYVLGYELYSDPVRPLRPVSATSVAYIGTHDMPPFASFWEGQDIETRLKVGLLDAAGAVRERENRRRVKQGLVGFLKGQGWLAEPVDILKALQASLAFLSTSRGHAVLVNLEDLWLERQPQNIPGTAKEYPNWRRKVSYPFEEFCHMPPVTGTLETIESLRRQGQYAGAAARHKPTE